MSRLACFALGLGVALAAVGCDKGGSGSPAPSGSTSSASSATTTTVAASAASASASASAWLTVAIPSPAELLDGPLPMGPMGELVRMRCMICHTEDYLVAQRLSPEGWKKTVGKMQKFGAPANDDEVTQIAGWLARMYGPTLPRRVSKLAELPPSGASSAQ